MMFVFCLPLIDREVIYRRHSHLLSLAKDEKLGKYTVPIGNRTPRCRMAVHYYTTVPRQLPNDVCKRVDDIIPKSRTQLY